MINATELRIGNYVSTPNQKYFRIDLFDYVSKGIGKFGQTSDKDLHPLTWYLQDLKPIPLTEEILLKCGFKLEKYKSIFAWVLSFGFYSILGFIGDKFTLYSNGDETETEIEYLHQLQNLYWCLVGEELEINL